MTEEFSIIRRAVFRKKKIVDDEIDCRSRSVGKQWSDSLKYARVENKKSMLDIRIAAEVRDKISNTFENIINNLAAEMANPSKKFISTNEILYSARKLVEYDTNVNDRSVNRGRCNSQQNVAFYSRIKKKSNESLLNSSMNKNNGHNNSTISVSEKKKPKNLNDFILKKI